MPWPAPSFHGKRGELRQRNREGQEKPARRTRRRRQHDCVVEHHLYAGRPSTCIAQMATRVRPEDEARLSPLGHEHINLLGRYSFAVPESVARGELRPLRNPADGGR